MHICLVCVEIFAWGRSGGFGRATRTIGRELVQRGVQVTAIVPRRGEQGSDETLDGIRVLSFNRYDMPAAYRLYSQVGADIFHSQEPSFGTYLAQQAAPGARHVVTCRDTRDAEDWRIERNLPSVNKLTVVSNQIYEDNWLVKRALHHADGLYAASYFVANKAQKKYKLPVAPEFLPTPVRVPAEVRKAEQPTVCFISRFDRRKRPEIYFELARQFPDVRFLAVGASRDPQYNEYLSQTYGGIPNLEMLGFVDQFKGDALASILGPSWILVNTSAREGLPNAFIEAAAHRCAILSSVDPDSFASRFGYFAEKEDFAEGLRSLLEGDRWREQGQRGYEFIDQVFETNRSIDRHLEIYSGLLKKR
jgi:glycosyltransferase involved in cell wall biosynthesis